MTKAKAKPLIVQATKAQTGHPLKNLLLIYLADYWSAENGAYPSQTTLAKRCGGKTNRQYVNTMLGELERDGWITSKQRKADNGADSSKEYHLNPAKLGVRIADRGCRDSGQGVSAERTGGVAIADTISLLKSPKKSLLKITPIVPLGDCRFDEFYSAYPRKAGKQAAKKAWDKLNPPPSLINQILQDIRSRVQQGAWCTGDGKGFIPHPSTYLNQARWEDEIIPRPDFKPSAEQLAARTQAIIEEIDREDSWIK